MPSSVAVMISAEFSTPASASGLFSATGKLAMRLKYSAAVTEAVVASNAAVIATRCLGLSMMEPLLE
ncbi:hypothetical protein D3C87_2085660 [compost metagenome]